MIYRERANNLAFLPFSGGWIIPSALRNSEARAPIKMALITRIDRVHVN